MLHEVYSLPFHKRPNLTRNPVILSGYSHAHRQNSLLEKCHRGHSPSISFSQTFFNHLFLVPKPNQKWRPILDLSTLNHYLKVTQFKIEIPDSIRISLQEGEWVTSIDFKDAYFHVPTHPHANFYGFMCKGNLTNSRRFHLGSSRPLWNSPMW